MFELKLQNSHVVCKINSVNPIFINEPKIHELTYLFSNFHKLIPLKCVLVKKKEIYG